MVGENSDDAEHIKVGMVADCHCESRDGIPWRKIIVGINVLITGSDRPVQPVKSLTGLGCGPNELLNLFSTENQLIFAKSVKKLVFNRKLAYFR